MQHEVITIIPEMFKTLDEKIEDAKAILIVATKNNFGSLWKTLTPEMQANEDVLAFGKDLSNKLGVIKKQNEQPS